MTSFVRQWSAPLKLGLAGVVCAAAGLVWSVTGADYFWPRWVWFGVATALAAEYLLRRSLRVPRGRRRWLAIDVSAMSLLAAIDVATWALSGFGFFWPIFSTPMMAIILGVHAWIVSRMPPERERELTARVDTLTRTRRGALEGQAAELKRIERDLHDGAQARMVSLALNLGMAEELVRRDPDAAVALLGEARTTAVSALDDLRTVMNGIHPAVLADRGLSGGVRALALDLAVPVAVEGEPGAAVPAAVETAVYFAVAECLANTVKHSQATRAWVGFDADEDALTVRVGDDGIGGASLGAGTGLRGVVQRLEAFDGRLDVSSPAGGPTVVTIRVPMIGS